MDRSAFVARHPQLFHMAAEGSWDSIRERGLLSTAALVDLYDPPPGVRAEILQGKRRRSYVLRRQGLPDAVVRDQLPLKFLSECLLPGVSEQEFLDELNSRVFFFVDRRRLHRLLSARAYRKNAHTVITLDTARFLALHAEVDLAPYNTGSVHVPNMPARGPSTFVQLERYPIDHWRRRRGDDNAIVELTVRHSSPRLAEAVVTVQQWDQGTPGALLFTDP